MIHLGHTRYTLIGVFLSALNKILQDGIVFLSSSSQYKRYNLIIFYDLGQHYEHYWIILGFCFHICLPKYLSLFHIIFWAKCQEYIYINNIVPVSRLLWPKCLFVLFVSGFQLLSFSQFLYTCFKILFYHCIQVSGCCFSSFSVDLLLIASHLICCGPASQIMKSIRIVYKIRLLIKVRF